VRPGDGIRFRKLSIGAAYAARFKTDFIVEAATAVARGALTLAAADAQIAAFSVPLPPTPETSALLKRVPASATHPGADYRLAGDRCA